LSPRASRAVSTITGVASRRARSARSTSRPVAQRRRRRRTRPGRQAEVEQHEVEALARQRRVRCRRIAHPVDRVALEAQRAAQAFADHAVVFHQQQAHRLVVVARCRKGYAASRVIVGIPHRTPPMPATLRHTLLSFATCSRPPDRSSCWQSRCSPGAYWLLDPTPPNRVVLATGPEQGAYAEFGKRYAEELKKFGITVELRITHGATENLRLLADPKAGVDIAFAQGGAADRRKAEDPAESRWCSLGSLFYEPVWLFYRTGFRTAPASLADPDEPQAARRMAPEHRRARQWRAEPGAADDRRERPRAHRR
jgi:hypothetical protein